MPEYNFDAPSNNSAMRAAAIAAEEADAATALAADACVLNADSNLSAIREASAIAFANLVNIRNMQK